jgi:hypothetical protein
VNTLYCLEEWRGNREFHPQEISSPLKGTKFTPEDNFTPGGQSLPLGVKLRIGFRGQRAVFK